MSLIVLPHCAGYDSRTDLVAIPAITNDETFVLTISGTTLMDRENVAGLDGGEILGLVPKYLREIGVTADILREEGQIGFGNRIDILAFEQV